MCDVKPVLFDEIITVAIYIMSSYHRKTVIALVFVLQGAVVWRSNVALESAQSDQEQHAASKRSSVFHGSLFSSNTKPSLSVPSSVDFPGLGEEKLFDTSDFLNSQYYTDIHDTDVSSTEISGLFNVDGFFFTKCVMAKWTC